MCERANEKQCKHALKVSKVENNHVVVTVDYLAVA